MGKFTFVVRYFPCRVTPTRGTSFLEVIPVHKGTVVTETEP